MTGVRWRKSSYSGEQGICVEIGAWRVSSHSADVGNCVEVRPWHTSSHSTQQGNCVEVAVGERVVLARDSKDPDGGVLGFGAGAWASFVGAVKSGRLDLRR
ncbi:DUF397 domain-containing protein [Actinomadura fibrosa]|uniref:DUF397 domain-containing protein n=1 Tax=Actinomadura fibrosa TaxID=111802 RepID=A0ABW2XEN6_9ACTN|nr:DUF397 domain-containing protein [Actinomadura fibrosa]